MCKEVVWLKYLLVHLGVFNNNFKHVTINCNSQAAIAYTKDPKYYGKTKHIDMKYNFIKYMVTKIEVNIKYISMHDMTADLFTKPIAKDIFNKHFKSSDFRRC